MGESCVAAPQAACFKHHLTTRPSNNTIDSTTISTSASYISRARSWRTATSWGSAATCRCLTCTPLSSSPLWSAHTLGPGRCQVVGPASGAAGACTCWLQGTDGAGSRAAVPPSPSSSLLCRLSHLICTHSHLGSSCHHQQQTLAAIHHPA
jgi:hypothetical protein